jgi:hypothetical protein
MSAVILDRRHWRAAQQRRHLRNEAGRKQAKPLHLTLDDIAGPAFDPSGGAA